MAKTTSDLRKRALAAGYRSGLEEDIQAQLQALGVVALYEPFAFKYPPPKSEKSYTPDFVLPNGIVIETKGRFVGEDRTKHQSIKKTHPDLDIRFVFQNPNQRLSASSQTTYADWATKNGFLWAAKRVPEGWVCEATSPAKLSAIQSARNWKSKQETPCPSPQ